MHNKRRQLVLRGLVYALLLSTSACAVDRNRTDPSPDPAVAGTATDADADNGQDGLQPPELLAAADATEDGETPPLWNEIRSPLYAPDPEHSTLEAEPEPQAGPPVDETAEPPAEADTSDLWSRLRSGFAFPAVDRPRIDAELEWYASHPEYLDRSIERARPYLYLIADTLEQRKIPLEIALLPIVESAFQPFAYSHGRAAGIWQFIPGTARHFGLKQNWWYDGRRDIVASTNAALDYLQRLQREFDGDWLLALAAYNSGAGTVRHAILVNQRRGRPTDFWSLQLPRETRAYVPKLLALARLVADPERHGLTLASIPDDPVVTLVDTGAQIDLAKVAELADMPLEDVYRLNPAFNRWATDPDGPHTLLLPIDKAADFSVALSGLDDGERVKWIRHQVHEGETLGHIALHYRTTVAVLKQVNDIDGHMIRAGRSLIVPVARRDLSSYTLSLEQRRHEIQNHSAGRVKVVYTVRSGDTLWDISRKYSIGVRELARWNAMAPRDFLKPGQRLVIWQGSESETASLGDMLNDTHPMNNVNKRIDYVVRKGDSLARISQRFNVKISELRSWNSLPKNQYLQPGQRITVYVNVTDQTESI